MDPTSEPTEPQVYDVEVKPKELAKILDAQLAEEAEAMEALMAEYRKLQEAQRDTKQKRAALYWKIREQERLEAEAQRREEEAARALIHAALLKQKAVHFDEVTKGAKWRARAMPHQLDGSSHLAAAGRAILADQPGLGKTLASIIWMDKLEANRVLIIGPGDVGINFVNELNLYSDRPVMDLSNQPKATQQMFLAHAKRFDKVAVFLNYEAWYRNLALLDWVIEANFDTLVVDEAHRVKETDKLPYKGVEAIVMAETQCPRCHAPINANVAAGRWDCTNPDCDWDSYTNIGEYKRHQRSSIQNLLLMTGTPIPNRPSEMFALLHLVDPVLFGTKKKFTDDYTKMVGNFEVWKSPEIRDTFASKLSAFYLRRTYESVGIELPAQDVIYHNIEFQPELYPKQAKLMKQLRKFNQMEIEKDRTMTIWQKIVLLLRERQAATWPGGIVMKEYVYDEKGNLKLDFLNTYKNGDPRPVTRDIHVGDLYQESQKIDLAFDLMMEAVQNGVRVVIFSQFLKAIERLKELADNYDKINHPTIPTAVVYAGSTPKPIADKLKVNFDKQLIEESGDEPMAMVMLAHYKKGGLGLNLTAATTMIILDEEWNPAGVDQAYGRICRLGQTEKTIVHVLRLQAPGYSFVDAKMSEIIKIKREMLEKFDATTEENSSAAMAMHRSLDELLNSGGEGFNEEGFAA